MDLDELNDNFQVSLEQLKQSQEQSNREFLQELQSLQTSLKNTSNTEQTSELKSLKEFVFKMQDNLQKSNAENLKKIAEDYSEKIKTISQSVVDDTVKSIRRNSNTLNEETKKFNEELREIKRTHFGMISNTLVYCLVGAFIAVVAYAGFYFVHLKHESLKELAESAAKTSIEKEAVSEYKKTLTGTKKGIVELKELELKWAGDEKNVKWQDREKTLQGFKNELQWAKDLQK